MDSFQTEKLAVLSRLGKPDKSKKGDVDVAAWPFIEMINGLDKFYTTSSCAGRISIFLEPKSGKKRDASWLYVTHDAADFDAVKEVVSSLPKETIWFRMEPPIFHIACSDLDSANNILRVVQSIGWKRSGIISTGGKRARQNRFMIEIVGNERIDSPIAINGKLLFDHDYLEFLVGKANNKLLITRRRLDELKNHIFENINKL